MIGWEVEGWETNNRIAITVVKFHNKSGVALLLSLKRAVFGVRKRILEPIGSLELLLTFCKWLKTDPSDLGNIFVQFVSLSALNTRFKIELLCSGTTADVVWVLFLEGGDDASRLNSFQGFQGSISSPESLTLWMCRISCQHYSFSKGSNSAAKQQIMYEASPQVVFIYFIPLQVLCFSASHSGSSASHFLCISFIIIIIIFEIYIYIYMMQYLEIFSKKMNKTLRWCWCFSRKHTFQH